MRNLSNISLAHRKRFVSQSIQSSWILFHICIVILTRLLFSQKFGCNMHLLYSLTHSLTNTHTHTAIFVPTTQTAIIIFVSSFSNKIWTCWISIVFVFVFVVVMCIITSVLIVERTIFRMVCIIVYMQPAILTQNENFSQCVLFFTLNINQSFNPKEMKTNKQTNKVISTQF